MDKRYLMDYVLRILNDDSVEEMKHLDGDAKDKFYINAVKRLLSAYKLYKANNRMYTGDYLIALRDYLITFETTIKLKELSDSKFDEYGISVDSTDGTIFATLQLPKSINEKFVNEAFIKNNPIARNNENVSLMTDPMIFNLLGYSHFKSMDQKLAVYGALFSPEGYSTLVSLPTGGGKSLITQAIAYQKEGLTIVIVPTVSLAIDQERVTKKVVRRETKNEEIFYYSSGVEAGQIFKAIKEKKARVLFISPEALLENPGFNKVISEANKARYLKNVVIDEAHIIVDWGASFRVDYQCLESWRNMLLMTNPSLRTFLLSATFDDRCVDILKNFFSVNDKWIEIRCDALRHEPRYCIARAKSYDEKQKDILELVRKLPHPMILYVIRPSDAEDIKQMLSRNGINNVRTFTGLTKATQRKKLIDEWTDDKFEIIVATSAFGVGVDKGDVRTVLHTYIPENANAYYQELGRGGRDGLPCLSVMCLTPEDTTIGKDRISKRVLTTEKIVGRWDSMYNNPLSKRISNNRVFIDTTIKPKYAGADEFDDTPTSDTDQNWNIYVLLFLRRYNLIRILEVKVDNGRYMILIEIVDGALLNIDDFLVSKISEIREKEWNYYSLSYKAISNAMRSTYKACISELFFETYSKVYEYCAGCNGHTKPIVGDTNKFALKNMICEPLRGLTEEQLQPFGNAPELAVIAKEMDEIDRLIEKLIRMGVSMIVLPDDMKEYSHFLKLPVSLPAFVLSTKDMFDLQKMKGFFYTSGLVAVVYSENNEDVGKQFFMVRNNLCGNANTKVIHVVKENVYIHEVGKNILELIDGPSILSKALYV